MKRGAAFCSFTYMFCMCRRRIRYEQQLVPISIKIGSYYTYESWIVCSLVRVYCSGRDIRDAAKTRVAHAQTHVLHRLSAHRDSHCVLRDIDFEVLGDDDEVRC